MKVLIVDDSKAMRLMVARSLRQCGLESLEVEQAEDAPSALEFLRKDDPDLVLSDWNMPGMTGLELLQKLRAEGNEVKFGFVTSESTPAMRELASNAGALFLISKPFTADSFGPAVTVLGR